MSDNQESVEIAIIKTPAGLLRLKAFDNHLMSVDWLTENCEQKQAGSEFLIMIVQQLESYWSNPEIKFSIAKCNQGTVFMNRVWQALEEIPSGETRTYGDIAKLLNTSPRAIGNACRKNPLPVFVPCHRVVSATGIGGYDGQVDGKKLSIKLKLLAHEQRNKLTHEI